MNLQTILPYVPFLAVLYALFALLQALRHKQQGIVATLLALIAVAAPVIAYIVSTDTLVRASLTQYLLINAAVVFIASLITLLIERRNPQRDPSHSYGMFGIGVSMILVVAMFALPLLLTSGTGTTTPPAFASSANTTAATTATNAANTSNTTNDNGQIVLASDNASENLFSQSANTTTNSSQAANESSQDAAIAQATVSAPLQAATEIPTEAATVVRPTLIVFPTDTPTPEATDMATDEATAEASAQTASSAATCTLVVDYDLNLRNQPTTTGSTVLLSIPYGSTVTTDGKTSDGWYRVSYNDQSGWVNGQYVTASASCSSLATVSAS